MWRPTTILIYFQILHFCIVRLDNIRTKNKIRTFYTNITKKFSTYLIIHVTFVTLAYRD